MPGLGNLLEFRRDRFAALARLRREAGDIAAVRFGPREVLIVSRPDAVGAVLGDAGGAFEKGINYGYLRQLLGEGLVTSEGERHGRQRKKILPMLAPRRAERAIEAFASAAESRVARWDDGATLDVASEMHALALEGMSRALCGGPIAFDAAEIGRAFRTENHWVLDLACGLLRTDLARWLPRRRRLARSIAELGATMAGMIAERRARSSAAAARAGSIADATPGDARAHARGSEAGSPPGDARAGSDVDTRRDLLDALLDAEMTDREALDEAVTLLFAGHETTASALSFALWHLSRSPRDLDRIADDPAWARSVLEESMRLHPPVPLVGRRAVRDVTIAGFDVPRGQVVYVDLQGLHRRPEVFAEPERFDPSRARPASSFAPFAAGPRSCAGASMAMAQGQAVLAEIARSVRLEPVATEAPELAVMVTLFARGGIPLRVRRAGASRSARNDDAVLRAS